MGEIVDLLTLSAGGYGSMLQTFYVCKYFNYFDRVSLIDDFLSDKSILDKYTKLKLPFKIGKYSDTFNVVTPSFNLDSLMQLSSRKFNYLPFKFNYKSNTHKFFNKRDGEDYLIPEHKAPFPNKKVVFKPIEGSGSKGIKIFENGSTCKSINGYICQEYCDGPELLVDCVKYDNNICYTCRLSVDRDSGRDSEIGFDFILSDRDRISCILCDINLHGYNGPFNIQMRKHDGRWKIMEIDFRFTGSSIINTAYDTLFSCYFKYLQSPRIQASDYKISTYNIYYLGAGFNERAIDIYENIGLPLPSMCE